MKLTDSLTALSNLNKKGVSLFTKAELGTVFQEKGDTLDSTVKRLSKSGHLTKVANGLYVNPASNPDENRLYKIAAKLRAGEVNYVSNESALCNLSIISQQMLDRVTLMTTGRSGIFKTPYGVVEFTHTKRSAASIVKSTTKVTGVPVLFADKRIAVRDLKRIGRNVNMIDWEAYEEED